VGLPFDEKAFYGLQWLKPFFTKEKKRGKRVEDQTEKCMKNTHINSGTEERKYSSKEEKSIRGKPMGGR